MSTTNERMLVRLEADCAAGRWYDAAQQYNALITRSISSNKFDKAYSLLISGVKSLGDADNDKLALNIGKMLFEMYSKLSLAVDDSFFQQVQEIVSALPTSSMRLDYLQSALMWILKGKHDVPSLGLGQIHAALASLHEEAENFPLSHQHRLQAPPDAARFATMLRKWFQFDTSGMTISDAEALNIFGLYGARSVLMLLCLEPKVEKLTAAKELMDALIADDDSELSLRHAYPMRIARLAVIAVTERSLPLLQKVSGLCRSEFLPDKDNFAKYVSRIEQLHFDTRPTQSTGGLQGMLNMINLLVPSMTS